MNTRKALLRSALAGVLALGLAPGTQAQGQGQGKAEKEKCYGIAKAGQNDCGTARHTCAGKSTKSNAPERGNSRPPATDPSAWSGACRRERRRWSRPPRPGR